jgi:uncharacterized membrane protein YeaQ/YmgE (transglycosylase-associated protein family)
MTWLTWIVVGALAGIIASLISGSRDGLLMMIVLGIIGAIVGGWLIGDVFKIADVTGVNATSIIVAVVGALLVIFVFGSLSGRRRGFGRN